jgi:tetraacyldisaccharide 4'-kinase
LAPLAPLYAGAVQVRAQLYARGWLPRVEASAPVISIGNLTVGGSGKTPVVEMVVRMARARGLRPAVLTRGYGRRGGAGLARVCARDPAPLDPALLGDEPAMLALANPDVPIYVGTDRVAAARLAAVLDRPTLFVLDDGFQHLRLRRRCDVLLLDAERGLGNGRLLPWGPLREPAAALHRADAILLTKANLGDAERVAAAVRALGYAGPLFRCAFEPAGLRRLDGGCDLPLAALRGRRVSLLSGIAQPGGFATAVRALGAEVAERIAFPDHHPYRDLAPLEGRLAGADPGAPDWLTTEKDAVKLRGRLRAADRLWVLRMEVRPEPAAEGFFFDLLARLAVESGQPVLAAAPPRDSGR